MKIYTKEITRCEDCPDLLIAYNRYAKAYCGHIENNGNLRRRITANILKKFPAWCPLKNKPE